MEKNMFGFSDRLKDLRDKAGITQSELARRLSLTRAGVNAWEMGLSAPSTPLIVELAELFHVTTDYLLGLETDMIIRTDGLNDKEIAAVMGVVDCFLANKKTP